MNSHKYNIICRSRKLINTDPQRRCYNGCHYSTKLIWTKWELLDSTITSEKAELRIKFWAELNDYAVSQRGNVAKREFKIIEVPEGLTDV
jgi:hypothetical protein